MKNKSKQDVKKQPKQPVVEESEEEEVSDLQNDSEEGEMDIDEQQFNQMDDEMEEIWGEDEEKNGDEENIFQELPKEFDTENEDEILLDVPDWTML